MAQPLNIRVPKGHHHHQRHHHSQSQKQFQQHADQRSGNQTSHIDTMDDVDQPIFMTDDDVFPTLNAGTSSKATASSFTQPTGTFTSNPTSATSSSTTSPLSSSCPPNKSIHQQRDPQLVKQRTFSIGHIELASASHRIFLENVEPTIYLEPLADSPHIFSSSIEKDSGFVFDEEVLFGKYSTSATSSSSYSSSQRRRGNSQQEVEQAHLNQLNDRVKVFEILPL